MPKDIDDKDVYDINREKVFMDPRRITMVTEYIMNHFDQKHIVTNKHIHIMWYKM